MSGSNFRKLENSVVRKIITSLLCNNGQLKASPELWKLVEMNKIEIAKENKNLLHKAQDLVRNLVPSTVLNLVTEARGTLAFLAELAEENMEETPIRILEDIFESKKSISDIEDIAVKLIGFSIWHVADFSSATFRLPGLKSSTCNNRFCDISVCAYDKCQA